MKIFLGLIVIVATLVIAGRQPENKTGRIICIFLCGFMVFSAIAKLPNAERKSSTSYSPSYSTYTTNKETVPSKNTKPALTKELAEKLRGSGYHNTRPNSVAEETELKAGQVKCKECEYHSDNGSNSLCDYCQWKQNH